MKETKLLIAASKDKNESWWKRIFNKQLAYILKETPPQNKEDLQQELITSLIKKTKEYKLDKVPGSEEFKKRM